MEVRKYNDLPEEAKHIREVVFVEEQGFVEEFDSVEQQSTHLVFFEGDLPIATCRFYWNEEKRGYVLGRIAVLKEYRGKNIGAQVVAEAEKHIREAGGKEVLLSAQERASEFYKKQGYLPNGEIYYEEYCPHLPMKKVL